MMRFPFRLARHCACLLCLVMSSCAAGPVLDLGPRLETYAPAPETSGLGRRVAAMAAANPGRSGFAIVEGGAAAFAAREGLVERAERSVDLQYFIWEPDATGLHMLAELAAAAERGVRVRVLLDDLYTGQSDPYLALLDGHPNAEVRFFNASLNRENPKAGFVRSFATFNHRMHNKAFIADNAIALIGGRNISDKYFVVDPRSNFRDLDLLAAGPVVRDISASFDAYWNSPLSVRLDTLLKKPFVPLPQSIAGHLRLRLLGVPEAKEKLRWLRRFAPEHPLPPLEDLVWAPAAVLVDDPDKPLTGRATLLRDLLAMLDGRPRRALLFEVAYVIPLESGLDYLCGLVRDGVRVRGLTNSFRSNDLLVTHAGYAEFRRQMVGCGIELYELRADARFVHKDWRWVPPTSSALLHTKAMVFDERWAFVSSLNLDPRSIALNTELGILIDSPEISARLTRFIEDGMAPDNAYSMALEDGDLVWRTVEQGRAVSLTTEPGTDAWDRLAIKVLALLPIEGML